MSEKDLVGNAGLRTLLDVASYHPFDLMHYEVERQNLAREDAQVASQRREEAKRNRE